MEPEGSLPCTEEPATAPNPEPNELNPHPQILFNIRCNIVLSCFLAIASDHLGLSIKILHAFISSRVYYIHGPSHPPWFDHSITFEAFLLNLWFIF
jgi:hypothetical protein